jgi:hypothetical protein
MNAVPATLKQPQITAAITTVATAKQYKQKTAWLLHSWVAGVKQHVSVSNHQPAAQQPRKGSLHAKQENGKPRKP